MSHLDILVDTNLLWNRALRDRLTARIEPGVLAVYVPTVIYAERIRQIADKYGKNFALSTLQQFVDDSKFTLIDFTKEDAEALAYVWLELKARGYSQQEWRAHRLDILLCAVARSRGVALVTDDQGVHFEAVSSRLKTAELEQLLNTM